MSAITTTGSTVFVGLDHLPAGTLLWRGMLQWFGGIGIVVVAMIFLPVLKVGGMQLFRSEAFDTLGKILPAPASIALQADLDLPDPLLRLLPRLPARREWRASTRWSTP